MVDADRWKPLGFSGRLFFGGMAALIVWFQLKQQWVPILDDANLVFHEAGHPIFGLFGTTFQWMGGTLGQLVFPVVTTITYFQKREMLGVAFGSLWFFENWLNIARYMADARAQVLPLVGGGEHDWATLFSRMGLLNFDTKIAGVVSVLAWLGILYTLLRSFFYDRSGGQSV